MFFGDGDGDAPLMIIAAFAYRQYKRHKGRLSSNEENRVRKTNKQVFFTGAYKANKKAAPPAVWNMKQESGF